MSVMPEQKQPEPDYCALAWMLRSHPAWNRRKILAGWIEASLTALSDEAKRATLNLMDSTFNESDAKYLGWDYFEALRQSRQSRIDLPQ